MEYYMKNGLIKSKFIMLKNILRKNKKDINNIKKKYPLFRIFLFVFTICF